METLSKELTIVQAMAIHQAAIVAKFYSKEGRRNLMYSPPFAQLLREIRL